MMKSIFFLSYALIAVLLVNLATGFTSVSPPWSQSFQALTSKRQYESTHFMSTTTEANSIGTEATVDDDITEKGLLKRDRYVATNRFSVRKGQQAKFEKRWATRKSRLATLPGFQYFHLMRRVTLSSSKCLYDEGMTDAAAQENYVSFTIWNKKSDFSAWRTGEAFKEAHGGTSITAFLSTMVNSAMVLRGAPRPAFYDGLLLQKTDTPTFVPETVDGWRNVEADGINTLPAECFVEMVKYYIPPGKDAKTFEGTWKSHKDQSPMTKVDGYVTSLLLRRDGQAKGYVRFSFLWFDVCLYLNIVEYA
jgi:heme-degrading monooxygenase HmoA